MKRIIAVLAFFCVAATLLVSCGAPVVKKDYLFVPISRAQSGIGAIGDAGYDQQSETIRNLHDRATIAFYKGEGDTGFKKVESNAIQLYSVNRQELTKFIPNKEDILLMKAAFIPGYDYSAYTIFSDREFAVANHYIKDIEFDINSVKNGVMNTDYALVAINVGNSALTALTIIDVLPENIEFVSSKFATKDDFVPLNIDLAQIGGVHHKVIKEGAKSILVFDVDGSIEPSKMVEIVVNVNVRIPAKTR